MNKTFRRLISICYQFYKFIADENNPGFITVFQYVFMRVVQIFRYSVCFSGSVTVKCFHEKCLIYSKYQTEETVWIPERNVPTV